MSRRNNTDEILLLLQSINGVSTETVDVMSKAISMAYPDIQTSRDEEILLFIGRKGAGKSTTAGYALGCNFYWDEDKFETLPSYPKGTDASHFPETRKGFKAHTLKPITYKRPGYPSCIDVGGFDEDRGPVARAFVSVSMQMSLNLAKRIKALVVVIDFRCFEVDRGTIFFEIMNTLGRLLRRPEEVLSSIIFAFTHVEEKYSKDQEKAKQFIIKNIRDMIKEVNETIAKISKQSPIDMGLRAVGMARLSDHDEIQLLRQTTILKILTLIEKGQNNIIIIDILDKQAKSRDALLKFIRNPNLPLEIPKGNFNFSDYDTERMKFDDLFSTAIKIASNLLDKRDSIAAQISQTLGEIEEIDSIIKRDDKYREALDNKEFDVGSSNKIDPKTLRFFLDDQKQNALKIEDLRAQITEIKSKIDSIILNQSKIDTSDPELHWEESIDEKRSWYGILGYTSKEFVYKGIPFFSVEEQADGKEKKETFQTDMSDSAPFKNRKVLLGAGQYESTYESRYYQDGKALVRIYVERRAKPQNKQQIELYKGQSSVERSNIRNLQDRIRPLQDRQKVITDMLNSLDGKPEERLEILNKKIATLTDRRAQSLQRKMMLLKTLETLRENQNSIEKEFESKKVQFDNYLGISEALHYNSSLISEFANHYKKSRNTLLSAINAIKVGSPIPEKFRCSLSNIMMMEPVSAPCGHTFERVSIEQNLAEQKRDESGCGCCPICQKPLHKTELIPNSYARNDIEEWKKEKNKSEQERSTLENKISLLEYFEHKISKVAMTRYLVDRDLLATMPSNLQQKTKKQEEIIKEIEKSLDSRIVNYDSLAQEMQNLHEVRKSITGDKIEKLKELDMKDITVLDEDDNNLLTYAAKEGASYGMIKLLVERKSCDPEYRNKLGQNVLDKMIRSSTFQHIEQMEIIRYLLQKGISLDDYSIGFSIFINLIRDPEINHSDNSKVQRQLEILVLLINTYLVRQQAKDKRFDIDSPVPVMANIALPIIHAVVEYGHAKLIKGIIDYFRPDLRRKYPENKEGLSVLQRAVVPQYSGNIDNKSIGKVEVLLSKLQKESDERILSEALNHYKSKVGAVGSIFAALNTGLSSLKELNNQRKLVIKHFLETFQEVKVDVKPLEIRVQHALEDISLDVFERIYVRLDSNADVRKYFFEYIKYNFIIKYYDDYHEQNKQVKPSDVLIRKLNALCSANSRSDEKSLNKIIGFHDFIYEHFVGFGNLDLTEIRSSAYVHRIVLNLLEIFHDNKNLPKDFQSQLSDRLEVAFAKMLEGEHSLLPTNELERKIIDILHSIISQCLTSLAKKSMNEQEFYKIIQIHLNATLEEWFFAARNFYTKQETSIYEFADILVGKIAKSVQESKERNQKKLKENPETTGLLTGQQTLARYLIKQCYADYYYNSKVLHLDFTAHEATLTSLLLKKLSKFDASQLSFSAAIQRDYQEQVADQLNSYEEEKTKSINVDKVDGLKAIELKPVPIVEDKNFHLKIKAFKISFNIVLTRYLSICDALLKDEIRNKANWAERWNNAVAKIANNSGFLSGLTQNLGEKMSWLQEMQHYLPTASFVIQFMLGAVDSYLRNCSEKEARNLLNAFSSDKIEVLDELDKIGDLLVHRYKFHLQKATVTIKERRDGKYEPSFDEESGVVKLAVCAAGRIVMHLKANKSFYRSSDEAGFINWVMKTGRTFVNKVQDRYDEEKRMLINDRCLRALVSETELGRNIPLNATNVEWNVSGVYDKCGFIVHENEGYEYYISKNSEPEVYGFSFIDKAEVVRRKLTKLAGDNLEKLQVYISKHPLFIDPRTYKNFKSDTSSLAVKSSPILLSKMPDATFYSDTKDDPKTMKLEPSSIVLQI